MLRPPLGLVLVLLATLLAGPVLPAPGASASAAHEAATVVRAEPRPAERRRADSLVRRLRALPSVVRVEERGAVDGRRAFVIGIRQPVDHTEPRGATFVQRVVLLHRGVSRPTVLVTDGYSTNVSDPRVSEPTEVVDGNQVSVEHRFFASSRPSPAPRSVWARTLTIRQAAADHHRVVAILKRLYDRRWISTGASKSGMAATYFRRFYPDDVAATVAYVAPNDVVDDRDDAYRDFLARVGTTSCRNAVVAVQRRVLGEDRAWFLGRTRQEAQDQGLTWRIVGSSEKAWEAAVVEVRFAFWQYQQASSECAGVPTAASSREDVWGWLERVSPPTLFADQPLRPYVPCYVQAAAQLGAPAPEESRIADLLRFPGTDVPLTFVPASLKPIRHDATAMPDVDRWVRTRASRMMFLYGGNDPWTAEPFSCGSDGARRACYRMVVPGGTHGAKLRDLGTRQQRAAYDRIRRWAGVSGERMSARADVAVPRPAGGRGDGVRPL